MKTVFLPIALIVLVVSNTSSQWTLNPDNPSLVCNETCTQNNVQQVPDGNGGTYIFWTDARVLGCNSGTYFDIYGQHYNSSGTKQWEPSGRAILNYSGTVTAFKVLRSEDGEMIIGCLSNTNSIYDSLRFQKLDEQGAKLWPSDLLVGRSLQCGAPTYTLGIGTFNVVRDSQGYVVSLYTVYCGGASGNRISRFNSDGTLTGLFNGEPEGTQYNLGSPGLDRTYDGSNDVYVFYSDANGAGAHAQCLRVNTVGDTIWGPLDVLSGTNGLSYQFRGKSDENGIAFCYETAGVNGTVDLHLRKFNSSGSLQYSTVVAGLDGTQGAFDWHEDSDYFYICWADSRPGTNPGNFDVYAQKIDKATGTAQWTANGIEVFSQPNYTPSTECVITDNGEMIVCALSAIGEGQSGFNAQLVNPDGSVGWPSTLIIDNLNYTPFYSDYQITISESNVVVAWAETNPSGGADGIYISNFFELPSACPTDLNNDGQTNTTDLLLFISVYGCSSGCPVGDFNGDDSVNTTDLLIFISAMGSFCP